MDYMNSVNDKLALRNMCLKQIGRNSELLMLHILLLSGRICAVGNGGCSHMCANEQWGALCSCPVGYKLSSNGAICKGVCSMGGRKNYSVPL